MFEFTVVICLLYICWRLPVCMGQDKTDSHKQKPPFRKAGDPWKRY